MIPIDIPGAWTGRDRLGGDAEHAVFIDNNDNAIYVEPRWVDSGPRDEWVVQVQGPNAQRFERREFPSRRAAFAFAEELMYDHMHGLGPAHEFDFGGI